MLDKILKNRMTRLLLILLIAALAGCGSDNDDNDYDEITADLVTINTNELAVAHVDGIQAVYYYEQGRTSFKETLADGTTKDGFCQRLAFRSAQALAADEDFTSQYPDGLPASDMQIATKWNTDGAAELFVDNLGWAYEDVRIKTGATAHHALTLADAVFYFIPRGSDTAWKVSAQDTCFPEGFFSLRTAAKTGDASDQSVFKPVKQDAMENYLRPLPLYNAFKVEMVSVSSEGLTAETAAGEIIGVMVIAHGSDEAEWNSLVQDAVDQADLPYPKALGFLEFHEHDIAAAVAALEAQHVNKIIAVPLFICSYSNHIEEIRYVLGLRDSLPEAKEEAGHGEVQEEELTPIETDVQIILTPALDDAPGVADILTRHLAAISTQPEQEIAVLVGHGGDSPECLEKWDQNFSSLAHQVKTNLGLQDARYGYAAMGEPGLADVVSKARTEGEVLVVPVMLSRGYFIQIKIPGMLEGLDYHYADLALLPDPAIAALIQSRVTQTLGH